VQGRPVAALATVDIFGIAPEPPGR